jgi:hypothetical protein
LLASIKAFLVFFALASADFYDFLALALAAFVTSYAFREALSSASSDAIRALAIARAAEVQQRKKRSQINNKKKLRGKQVKDIYSHHQEKPRIRGLQEQYRLPWPFLSA